MTVPANEGQGFSQDGSQGSGTGINPAWNDLLANVPEENYSKVQPILEQWDNNYRQVQQRYQDWDGLVESGYTPDEVNSALGVMMAINSQPEEVLKALQESINAGQEPVEPQTQPNQYQSQGQQGTEESFDITTHPEFQRLNDGFSTMAQILQAQHEREEAEQEDAIVEQELAEARQKHGDYTKYGDIAEQFIVGQMMNEVPADQAVQNFFQFVQGFGGSGGRPAPTVLGPSGSIPNPNIDPKTLDQKGRRNLIADMLREAQGQQ